MERLKTMVPESLKQRVKESTSDDLPFLCSSVLSLFHQSEVFHQLIRDLATVPERALCAKNKDAALESKRLGNGCFVCGDYANALEHYSQAVRVAPIDVDDMDKNLVATLYVNRAAVLNKIGLSVECLRDSNRALQISSSYAKAWYRRGKANASLGNFEDAICDLNVAKIVELSFSGRKQIEDELKIILDKDKHQSKRLNSTIEDDELKLDVFDESHQIELQCVTTENKGRGMASLTQIPPSTLIHVEEPYATIIAKPCRETHCHFCLDELPADKVPCASCSIPLYCSQRCQIQAGGKIPWNNQENHEIFQSLSDNLQKYIAEVTLSGCAVLDVDHVPEHKHECRGVHWPAILPSDVVLAGRIVAKSIALQGCLTDASNFLVTLNLCHNFSKLHPQSKLEFLIYSIVLLFCLQHSRSFKLPINGISISQIVILLSQIRMNSISIVRMKSTDALGPMDQSEKNSKEGSITSNVEQVKVGQAIYMEGSLFNHSCKPNTHAYFVSRSLFIRSTEDVSAGCPLELSYGPQVGQWDCKDRLKFLEDEYSFRCSCGACSVVNLADFVLNAFCCVNPNCSGIVLDSRVVNCEKQKFNDSSFDNISTLEHHLQGNDFLHFDHGYCLKCGSYRDMELSYASVDKAWIYCRRLQEAANSKVISNTMLSDALESMDLLRSTLHPYNRRIAEVEDSLAQAFCLLGDLRLAIQHCKASIEILEKLYGPNHIAIGYELLKLSSIQLSLGERSAVDGIHRLREIFLCYYGSHANKIFPYLKSLERETDSFA